MDCCKIKNHEGCCKDLDGNSENLKGGKIKMERNVLLWGVIGVLFIVALVLVFQVGASGVQAATSTAGAAAPSAGGMVGGC
ncbi:hypothetical protein COU58_00260 [Candidatus Pacearchaeota archaeon CG10_big_fil_rev_8_21_14_0_10_32_42]|nr:MAG: hypothetical protein COU58_00260 [Candidatus Pacearchaeota archaeon CG10_big_fil_rev_8_21_14_0_10_32_42]